MKSIIYIIAFVLILQTTFSIKPCRAQNNTSGTSGNQFYPSKNISENWEKIEYQIIFNK